MRCKVCQNTFQAKTKAAANYPVAQPANAAKPAVPVPTAKPAPAALPPNGIAVALPVAPPKTPANAPFGFEAEEPADDADMPRRRKQGSGGLFLLILFLFLFLVGLGGVGAVGYMLYLDAEKGNPLQFFAKTDDGDANLDDAKKDDNGKPADNGKKKPPIRKDVFKEIGKTDNGKKTIFSNDPFPRRALLISVNNYLMFNTVHFGSPQDASRYPGSSTSVLRDRLTRPPMNFPVTQVYELSDGIPSEYKASKPHSTQKSVLETTINDFLDSSRAQDRIVVLFAGHGINIEDKSYLIPIDGNKNNIESLLPPKWVYARMAKCKAQQKILILDVFRFSPSRGLELPSPGEGEEGTMPEGFEKDLANPPAGVQVWASCSKEQTAVELDEGSSFMQALCNSAQGGGKMTGISTPTQPIPIDDFVADVNERMKKLLTAEKRTQVSRLTGKPTASAVEYDGQEPLPPVFALKPPAVPGGEAAGAATIERILDELRVMPPVRETRASDLSLVKAHNLPAFNSKKIDVYKGEGYQNITDLQNKYKNGKDMFAKEFPLRAAYFDTLEMLQESKKVQMREVLSSPVDPKRKAAFLLEQEPLGISIFRLEGMIAAMKEADKQRENETSKRWHANFDYMQARLYGRVVYLYEYNYTLGKIRGDDLPELAPGQSGWRVGISGSKITVPDQKAKAFAKEAQKLWKHIQDEYPDTPWALLAQRESMIALGLAWRPKSD